MPDPAAELYALRICHPDEIPQVVARFENTIRRDFDAAAANRKALVLELVTSQQDCPDA